MHIVFPATSMQEMRIIMDFFFIDSVTNNAWDIF